jgi:hypothetical protein
MKPAATGTDPLRCYGNAQRWGQLFNQAKLLVPDANAGPGYGDCTIPPRCRFFLQPEKLAHRSFIHLFLLYIHPKPWDLFAAEADAIRIVLPNKAFLSFHYARFSYSL